LKIDYWRLKIDGLVKSLEIVMPDLIRHPERIESTGFRLQFIPAQGAGAGMTKNGFFRLFTGSSKLIIN